MYDKLQSLLKQMLYTTEFEEQMRCRKSFMTELEHLTLLDVPNAHFPDWGVFYAGSFPFKIDISSS